jgi:DNA polymerase III delta prime subunit
VSIEPGCVETGVQLTRLALFSVDWVEDITWQSDVFDNLVLSTDHKELVLGFVECHRGADDGFDDFIEGKGRSLIFLLSGPPGVGKTLTAEAGNTTPPKTRCITD